MNVRPWRAVTAAVQLQGQSSALNRSNGRTARWWELTLSCRHIVERKVRYSPDRSGGRRFGPRPDRDVQPHPVWVRCGQCPTISPTGAPR